jgi:hypothetical protein
MEWQIFFIRLITIQIIESNFAIATDENEIRQENNGGGGLFANVIHMPNHTRMSNNNLLLSLSFVCGQNEND